MIKNYQSDRISKINKNNFIFAYILTNSTEIDNYLKKVEKTLNIKIYFLTIFHKNQVKEFLYNIINSKAVITDSYHGTLFSIIFKKPFITFINRYSDSSRFKSITELLNIKNRIFNLSSFPSSNLLMTPLIFDNKKLMSLKRESINYLKNNLNSKYLK